jgi:hypothetical protein
LKDNKDLQKAATERAKTVVLDNLFKVNFGPEGSVIKDGVVQRVGQLPNPGELSSEMLDQPWVMKSEECVGKWKGTSQVQIALSTYAGQYKSTESSKTTGRSQCPMAPKEGKTDTDAMMSKLMEKVPHHFTDISKIPALAGVTSTTWMFGAMPAVGHCSHTPFGLSMVRILAMGKLRTVAFEVASLLKAVADLNVTATKLDDIAKYILNLDAAGLVALRDKGCSIHYVVQGSYETLYVPAGWMVADLPEGTLVHGVRKTFALASQCQTNSFNALIRVFEASGKSIDKMKSVLGLMIEATKTAPLAHSKDDPNGVAQAVPVVVPDPPLRPTGADEEQEEQLAPVPGTPVVNPVL